MTQVPELDRDSVYNALRQINLINLINHVVVKDARLLTKSYVSNLENAQLLAKDLVEDQIDTYAQQSCRALCAAMQRTLPRELRDMVYDHVLSPIPEDPLEIYDDAFDAEDGSYRDEIAEMVEDSGYAHMRSEDFVDLVTMREFARRWYTKVKLDLYLTPVEVSTFFKSDIWGLGLSIEGLLSHVEVKVFEDSCEDSVIPLQLSLFKLAPHVSIVFHLRTDMVVVDEPCDRADAMDILADRVSTLFPLMLQLIEAGYVLSGSLDQYEELQITPATLTKENVKNRLDEHHLWCEWE